MPKPGTGPIAENRRPVCDPVFLIQLVGELVEHYVLPLKALHLALHLVRKCVPATPS